MAFSVNPDLLGDEPATDQAAPAAAPKLPPGVYLEDEPIPEGRTELFRCNGRKYTLSKVVDPRLMFRYLRELKRNRGTSELAMAGLLYDVLGEAIVDALADEDLSTTEMQQVMEAVKRYTMSAVDQAGLGN